jgi:predicted amidophosphoribosyltransferase
MGLAASLLDLLVPARCPACGAIPVATWCRGCLEALDALALADDGLVSLDARTVAAAAYAYEGVVRDTLLAVKVGGQHGALAAMGSLLRVRLELPAPRPGLAVTWVPASAAGRRRRGADVARRLAGRGAVPLLRRVRAAPEQKRLARRGRRRSAAGLFAAVAAVPSAVVVVDDVRTTGATALAASRALQAAGAARVAVATFAAVTDAQANGG